MVEDGERFRDRGLGHEIVIDGARMSPEAFTFTPALHLTALASTTSPGRA